MNNDVVNICVRSASVASEFPYDFVMYDWLFYLYEHSDISATNLNVYLKFMLNQIHLMLGLFYVLLCHENLNNN